MVENKKKDHILKIYCAVGTRPNYMKVAPLIRAFKKYPTIKHRLIHTDQHYHENLSKVFFKDLKLPKPHVNFSVGSKMRNDQIRIIREKCLKYLRNESPDLLIVVGDVNSTLACAQAAHKAGIPLAHIEAGLRSYDESMPEEKNRKATDRISDILFTSCVDAGENLLREGIDSNKIFYVGNIMIDSLKWGLQTIKGLKRSHGGPYTLLTLHRPANTDKRTTLQRIIGTVNKLSRIIPIVFPAHPRVTKNIRKFGIKLDPNVSMSEPLGYKRFLNLLKYADIVVTDSGGLQEETSFLGIPCVTLRRNTERPITVTEGTNIIAGIDPDAIFRAAESILRKKSRRRSKIQYWDGKTSERITKVILKGF